MTAGAADALVSPAFGSSLALSGQSGFQKSSGVVSVHQKAKCLGENGMKQVKLRPSKAGWLKWKDGCPQAVSRAFGADRCAAHFPCGERAAAVNVGTSKLLS